MYIVTVFESVMNNNLFQVFNASAGAGKTYSLVKSYLSLLLSSNNLDKFKHILAITFTNKAVSEMKHRVLRNLSDFANPQILKHPTEMFNSICNELNIKPELIHKKSISIKTNILNNYAAFDILTLDRFTHRILRTFAHDLKLSQSFEVNLDTEEVLAEAVQNLIQKIGKEDSLTSILIEYALQKTNDDKSWDIGLDLFKTAKLLLKEGEALHIKTLKSKTIEDFKLLKNNLKNKIKTEEDNLISIGQDTIHLLKSNNLEKTDFTRGSLYVFFEKLSKANFSIKFEASWQKNLISGNQLYNKSTKSNTAETINQIQPQLIDAFENSKTSFFELQFLKNFEKNVIPLSVLFSINSELEHVKKEHNIVLISEFNSIIANEIKHQPAPFIYERLGNRYKNYFIDEFQDTSKLQWQNLIPLIDNTLVTESNNSTSNSLMIVGDAKQSIYRWRGGEPEQFINLYEGHQPFYIKNSIINLDTNYRSHSEIIEFNNDFFSYISEIFIDSNHKKLYQIGSNQKTNNKSDGYVNLAFVEDEDSEEQYLNKTLSTINSLLERNYNLKDICIITRKKSEGILVANHLSQNNIDIISSESLLLKNSEHVNFIISILNEINTPSKLSKVAIISFLFQNKSNTQTDEHLLYESSLNLEPTDYFEYINDLFDLNFQINNTLSIFEIIEDIIRSFNLISDSDAHIQYFLDTVFSFTQSKTSGGVNDFLEFWNTQKEKLSIVAPEGLNAITIMTIHKSKGLEFPIVIFPFADLNIYKEHEKKVWFEIDTEQFNGFTEAYLSLNKNLANHSQIGEELYITNQSKLELDNINLLYVTLTRAKKELFIISKHNTKETTNKGGNLTYSDLFITYLKSKSMWTDEKHNYTFGKTTDANTTTIDKKNVINFISCKRENHNLSLLTKSGKMWNTTQQEAIEKGNLIHLVLSKINYKRDIESAFKDLIYSNEISENQAKNIKPLVKSVINSDELCDYFEDVYRIYNEQAILSEDHKTYIPDRICLKNKTATIIDYKTGIPNLQHEKQIKKYGSLLEKMNFTISKKIIVYLLPEISFRIVK